MAGRRVRRRGSGDDASQITSWVESHFTSETVGGVTVYDLTSRLLVLSRLGPGLDSGTAGGAPVTEAVSRTARG